MEIMENQQKPLKQYAAVQYYLLLRNLKIECWAELQNYESLIGQLEKVEQEHGQSLDGIVNAKLKKIYRKVSNIGLAVGALGITAYTLNTFLNTYSSNIIIGAIASALIGGGFTLAFCSKNRLRQADKEQDKEYLNQRQILTNQIKRSEKKISKIMQQVYDIKNSEVIFYNADGTEMDYGDAAFYLYHLDEAIDKCTAESLQYFFGLNLAIPHQDEMVYKIVSGKSITLPNGESVSANAPAQQDYFDDEEVTYLSLL